MPLSPSDLAALRRSYERAELDESSSHDDPLQQFDQWLNEAIAAQVCAAGLWLTVWDGNTHALGFYDRLGYSDVGQTSYTMQSQSFLPFPHR